MIPYKFNRLLNPFMLAHLIIISFVSYARHCWGNYFKENVPNVWNISWCFIVSFWKEFLWRGQARYSTIDSDTTYIPFQSSHNVRGGCMMRGDKEGEKIFYRCPLSCLSTRLLMARIVTLCNETMHTYPWLSVCKESWPPKEIINGIKRTTLPVMLDVETYQIGIVSQAIAKLFCRDKSLQRWKANINQEEEWHRTLFLCII